MENEMRTAKNDKTKVEQSKVYYSRETKQASQLETRNTFIGTSTTKTGAV